MLYAGWFAECLLVHNVISTQISYADPFVLALSVILPISSTKIFSYRENLFCWKSYEECFATLDAYYVIRQSVVISFSKM